MSSQPNVAALMEEMGDEESSLYTGEVEIPEQPVERVEYLGTVDADGNFEWSGEGTPPLSFIEKIRRDKKVAGEAVPFQVVYLTFAGGGGMVAMIGPARTGKDQIVDGVEAALPDGFVRTLPTQTTEAAMYRGYKKMVGIGAARFKDIVSLKDHEEEALKAWGEGKDLVKELSVPDGEGGWRQGKITVPTPPATVYFLADDNPHVSLDDYPEVRDRSLVVPTDASEHQTSNVINYHTAAFGHSIMPKTTALDESRLKQHVTALPREEYDVGEHDDFVHPYNGYFDAHEGRHPIHPTFPEARFDGWRFFKFVNIVAMWHEGNRIKAPTRVTWEKYDDMYALWVTPQDLWLAMRVFGEKITLSALNLNDVDKRVLWFLRVDGGLNSVNNILQTIHKAGLSAAENEVRSSCEKMSRKGYLVRNEEGQVVQYKVAAFGQEVEEYNPLDWTAIIDQAAEDVYEIALDDEVADAYVERYLQRPVECVHPFTGRVTDIEEYQGFKKEIEQRQEEMNLMAEGAYTDIDPNDAGMAEEGEAIEQAATDGGRGSTTFGDFS